MGAEKYWYNFTTGAVEHGRLSPAIDRAGPFDTEQEAARAPDIARERSRSWAEEEARDADWGASGESETDR